MKTWYQSRRLRLLLELTAVFLILFGSMRLGFYFWFSTAADAAPLGDILKAFYIGAKFDVRATLLMLLPLLVMGLIPKYGLGHRRWAAILGITYLSVAGAALLLIYFFDFFHYDYLQQRMDASVLRFLDGVDTASVSAEMIWQSYPVPWLILAWLGLLVILVMIITTIFRHTVARPWRPVRVSQRLIGTVVVFVCFIAGVYGQLSWFPLRWSNALFSENRLVSSTALNPVLFFASTFKNRQREFDIDRTRAYYPLMAERLRVDDYDPVKLNYDRFTRPPAPIPGEKPNVVIIMLESLSTHWLGVQGNLLKPTPNMDALIADSIYFRRNYVPRFGTARSTWALVTGTPDVLDGSTATRNPLIVQQHSIFNAFEGYDKYYFIGGNANWANIRGVLKQSIPDLKIFEEGSYDDYPRVDAWGVSDLSVFDKAHRILTSRGSKRPFVAYIQTAGNHSPYTIPQDNRGFETREATYVELVSAAFASNPEYNGVRLLDHFLGEYFKLVRAGSYHDNTIFAFFGDHGLPRSKDANMQLDQALGIVELRAPMWIHAPFLKLRPEAVETTTSLLDLMPTVAYLAGSPFTNTTLGGNLLDPGLAADRSVFLMHKDRSGADRLGFLGPRYYLSLGTDGRSVALHDVTRPDGAKHSILSAHPDLARDLKDRALGFYETARYMLFHNPPKPHTASRSDSLSAGSPRPVFSIRE